MFDASSRVRRTNAGRTSHIPIPLRKSRAPSTAPQHHTEWQDLYDAENDVSDLQSIVGMSSGSKSAFARQLVATPRMPLSSRTNFPTSTSANRTPSSSRTILRSRSSLTKRRVSGERARPKAARAVRSNPPSSGGGIDGGDDRLSGIETQIASMQNLFDLERKRTEQLLSKEKRDRRQQEEKVRQLEEDLQEQRRMAMQTATRPNVDFAEEEIEQLLRAHQREKRDLEDELQHERMIVASLKGALEKQSTAHLTADSTIAALKSHVEALKATIEEVEEEKAVMAAEREESRMWAEQLEANLRDAESLRRKLHNEIQELRGNIRVFVRVRPSDSGATATHMRYPDELGMSRIELASTAETAMGTSTMRMHGFSFDRVFQPSATQADVFAEVEHLIQSVLDGYNTCIFAYGQTGSGKTYTLEGPSLPNAKHLENAAFDGEEGLIPRAVTMLWQTAEKLQRNGWQYSFEGQMLEIYNENINDLLGKAEVDKAKHEIRHEKGRTIVSDAVTVAIQSPAQLYTLLALAKKRRQVAATMMNERSSRSHSVFSLRVIGHNHETLESSDAMLNLVDLAGSERLSSSGSGKDATRLKETQNINRSLSSLGDVIMALGRGGGPSAASNAHIPYRNSVLTWLLKNSLGGNSKTLMLLTLSPQLQHEKESLCSLRFASKVNSTIIGTAKKVKASSSSTPQAS